MEHVVQELIEQKISIATMESCTGGAVANATIVSFIILINSVYYYKIIRSKRKVFVF